MAEDDWHLLEVRALERGIWGVPHGPARLLDLDLTVFLAFLEGVARGDEKQAENLDGLYAKSRRVVKARTESREERNARIDRFMRLTG